MDLSVFNDMVVEPGHYGRVTVIGKAAFKDGVFFDLLEVHGSLDAHHLTGNILTVDGAVTATGSIGVTCLNGSGDMRVAGDVRANRMQFTGRCVSRIVWMWPGYCASRSGSTPAR